MTDLATRGNLVAATTLLQELYDGAHKLDGDGYAIFLDAGEYEVLEDALDALALPVPTVLPPAGKEATTCPSCGAHMCPCCVERYGHTVCGFCRPSSEPKSSDGGA